MRRRRGRRGGSEKKEVVVGGGHKQTKTNQTAINQKCKMRNSLLQSEVALAR